MVVTVTFIIWFGEKFTPRIVIGEQGEVLMYLREEEEGAESGNWEVTCISNLHIYTIKFSINV